MAYTKELIDEVKELYPTSTEMIKLAELGSVWLGRYLDDSSPTSMSFKKILSATSLDDLQKEVMMSIKKIELYKKWCEQDPRRKTI